MYGPELSKQILEESPKIIESLEKDLSLAKETMSQHSVDAISSAIHHQQSRIKEAELSLKFVDYQ